MPQEDIKKRMVTAGLWCTFYVVSALFVFLFGICLYVCLFSISSAFGLSLWLLVYGYIAGFYFLLVC